jgi:hypothetical protein
MVFNITYLAIYDLEVKLCVRESERERKREREREREIVSN